MKVFGLMHSKDMGRSVNVSTIIERQNENKMLHILRAQRTMYSKAKQYRDIEISVTLFITVVFCVLNAVLNSEVISILTILFSLTAFVLGLYCNDRTKRLRKDAASMQQTFDSYVLGMNGINGSLDEHTVVEQIAIYSNGNFANLKNWYEDYSTKCDLHQVFCCQKENARWDIGLRKQYRLLMVTVFFTAVAMLMLVAIFASPSLLACSATLSLVAPILRIFITQYKELSDNIQTIIRIEAKMEMVQVDINEKKDDDVKKKLEGLQMLLYEHRKSALLVPDWFYEREREKYEQREKLIAEQHRDFKM